jgi:hypothetical protein
MVRSLCGSPFSGVGAAIAHTVNAGIIIEKGFILVTAGWVVRWMDVEFGSCELRGRCCFSC